MPGDATVVAVTKVHCLKAEMFRPPRGRQALIRDSSRSQGVRPRKRAPNEKNESSISENRCLTVRSIQT